MNDFRSFLLGKCRIPKKKVSFYLYWVSKYNTFSKSSSTGDDSLTSSYLNALSRKYEDWQQVQQAERAINDRYFDNSSQL